MDLSVIIVSYNNSEEVNSVLAEIDEMIGSADVLVEFIISDNSDTEPFSFRGLTNPGFLLKSGAQVSVVKGNGNSGFAIGANRGAAIATGKILLFLNSDIMFRGTEILDLFDSVRKLGSKVIIAPLLLSIDKESLQKSSGHLKEADGDLPKGQTCANDEEYADYGGKGSASGGSFHFRLSRILQKMGFLKRKPFVKASLGGTGSFYESLAEVDWVAGTVMMMNKETFVLGGGFSPSYFMYFEDVDLCWRLSKVGVKSLIHRGIVVGHSSSSHMSSSQLIRKDSDYRVSRNRFLRNAAAYYLYSCFPFLDLR